MIGKINKGLTDLLNQFSLSSVFCLPIHLFLVPSPQMSSAAELHIHPDDEQMPIDATESSDQPRNSPNTTLDPGAGLTRLIPSNTPSSNNRFCKACVNYKHKREFMTSRVPLQDLGDNPWNAPNVKLAPNCRECRDKRKALNDKRTQDRRRKSDEAKLLAIETCTWEELKRKYPPHSVSRLTLRGMIDLQKELHITDFYRHLPSEISKDDQKSIAQFVVDKYGQFGGYEFSFHKTTPIKKQAQGRLSIFAHGTVFRFQCSQRPRVETQSTVPYGKTRNRRSRITSYDCQGEVTVTFPSTPATFDFAIKNSHPYHPGRPSIGVPKYLRKWIFDNPESSPEVQRNNLLAAIARGEIPGADETFLNPTLYHYWWRKAYEEKSQPTDDPWENMRQTLENHRSVILSSLSRSF